MFHIGVWQSTLTVALGALKAMQAIETLCPKESSDHGRVHFVDSLRLNVAMALEVGMLFSIEKKECK